MGACLLRLSTCLTFIRVTKDGLSVNSSPKLILATVMDRWGTTTYNRSQLPGLLIQEGNEVAFALVGLAQMGHQMVKLCLSVQTQHQGVDFL
jgi:hypothetical protein